MRTTFLLLTLSITVHTYAQSPTIGADPYNYTVQKEATVAHGAVVSAHPLASLVGTRILQQHGNAVDAAIATQLALAVVYPAAGNLGGGGFLVGHLNNGKDISIDYREMAPAKASRDMYVDASGKANTALSQDGHLAAGVPGTVAGLFASLPYAKLQMRKLIQPAIILAEKGFAITEAEAHSLNMNENAFRRLNTRPNAFVRNTPWKAGDTLKQPELAKTLKRIRDKGMQGFYEGETAQMIVAEMQRGKGLITAGDLKDYKAKERKPLVFNYKNFTVITMPLPSSGGIVLQQMMGMVENYPLASYGFHSPQAIQLMVEVERRAYADRAQFLGDADFVKVPVKQLMDKKYLAQRMKDYDPHKAGTSVAVKAGAPMHQSEETTHLSVMDDQGNSVAVTTTLNGSYGSKVVVGGAGFFLNNEMDDFSIRPGVPNMYGLVGAEANAIAPGKRMLSCMTPTIVLQNNRPYLVLGTPGGSTIITSVFQTLMNILEFKMPVAQAINEAKFHHQWLPDQIDVEPKFPENTITALRDMGYKVNTRRNTIGRTEVIKVNNNGQMEAVGDGRGDDSAAGY